MARYIDADIAIEEIDKLQESLMSNNDTIWKKNKPIYKGLCNARGIINDTPTADVVPESEVDLYRKQVDELEDELASTYDKLENAKAENETLKDNNEHLAVILEETKAELARKIFEDLKEKYTEYFFDGTKDIIVFRKNDLAELEKKYREGE